MSHPKPQRNKVNSWNQSFKLLKSIHRTNDLEKANPFKFLKEAPGVLKRIWGWITKEGAKETGEKAVVHSIEDAHKIKAASKPVSTRVLDISPGPPPPEHPITSAVGRALASPPVGSKAARAAEKAAEKAPGVKRGHLTEHLGGGTSGKKLAGVVKDGGVAKISKISTQQLATDEAQRKLRSLASDYVQIENASDLHKIMKNPFDANNLLKLYRGKSMPPKLLKLYKTYKKGGATVTPLYRSISKSRIILEG